MARIPWIGLAALVGMFVIPYLPNWLFEGPRTVTHRPRRHVCGDCGAAWAPDHACLPAGEPPSPLRGELWRLGPSADLDRAASPARRQRKELTDRRADPRRKRSRGQSRRFGTPL
jgi:hypothetical protein